MINPSMFRAYDIRGISDTEISQELAYKIGYIFAINSIKSDNKLLCVGRDGRLSSDSLTNGLIQGIKEAGADVIYLGIVPTSLLYFADREFDAIASVMVTGSHNPKEYNGFKLVYDNRPFFSDMIKTLYQRIIDYNWDKITLINTVSNGCNILNIMPMYMSHVLEDKKKINNNLKIAIDPGNGAICECIKYLKNNIDCEIITINDYVDGNFSSRSPDPTVESNLSQLRDLLLDEKCDIGIAFDGDGDRIVVLDRFGSMIHGDMLLCVYVIGILNDGNRYLCNERVCLDDGIKVIADVKSSQILFDYLKSLGGEAIMCKTGHPFIKDEMRKTGALLAAEMSGHIFFKENGYDDALYATVELLKILSILNKPIDKILSILPQSFNTPEIRINLNEEDNIEEILDSIYNKVAKQDVVNIINIDGVRVVTDYGWWLIRSSNTEDIFVLRLESPTQSDMLLLKEQLFSLLSGIFSSVQIKKIKELL